MPPSHRRSREARAPVIPIVRAVGCHRHDEMRRRRRVGSSSWSSMAPSPSVSLPLTSTPTSLIPLVLICPFCCPSRFYRPSCRRRLSWKCRFFRCRPQLILTTWCRVFPTRRPDTAVVSATSCDVGFFFSVSYVVSLPNCRHVVVVSTTKYLTPCVFDLLYPSSSSSQHNHHNYSANFPPAPAAAI